MNLLQELEASVQAAVEHVGASVVGLGRGWGVGSGVVIAPGRVLTNAHNLRHDETTVSFADGRRATARVAGVDHDIDLAEGTTTVNLPAEPILPDPDMSHANTILRFRRQ